MKKVLYELIINNDVQILKNNIDWYALFSSSIAEKVEGYLFKFILDNNLFDNIPKPIRKMLYVSFQYNQQKNTLYVKEFQNIQQLLSANRIHVYPYKGLYLLEHIYINYGIRYMEDMDIISFEPSYYILKEILKDLDFQLILINDIDVSLYVPGTPISSCLFIKRYPVTNLVPLAKLDVSFMPKLLKEYEVPYYNSKELTPQYNFYLLCKSLYNDACAKNKNPAPEDCTLMKLIDIIKFAQKYPKKAEHVFDNSPFSNMEFIKYTRICIKYFSKEDVI